ncbi:MAG TPA: DNA gyrase subunit A [Planctomycetota bacterium]|nr:DNA gyrase subunit A [Planctomycetota bacterium]
MADPKSPAPAPPPAREVISTPVEEEMKESYLNYAMSVIVSRALPDVRDGLKPSQRRILHAMNELGVGPRSKTRKCATIVGETMGKWHPHGDMAIYPTLVRLAQDFATRYTLVMGQGNFGSVDGDPPAAMRYTEARLTDWAAQMLEDLDKRTVDYQPNFDGSLEEPIVLPSKFPNLLCNGAVGIAVGMATSIPPHNLGEVCDALIHLIAHPQSTVADMMAHIPGPDFPTGGIICGAAGIREAYETGRGLIRVRGRVHVEEARGARKNIILDEIPYNVNKASLIERIAELVKEDHITGISDIRDESDRTGMRVVIECGKGEDENIILNQLYAMSSLQETFSIITIALVNGRPVTLNLKDLLQSYLDHRREVIRRRTRYLLEQAEREAHILEGLVKALDIIDEIIALIRASASPATAKAGLVEKWAFTDLQADAILRMTLARLTGLEREKLVADLAELQKKVAEYRAILADAALVDDIIREDLHELKKSSDERRTEIQAGEVVAFEREELIPEEDMVVVLSHLGYVKRVPLASYRKQRRGGKGIIGAETKETDFIERLIIASTHDHLLFFTNTGRVHWLKVYDLPALDRTARGKPLATILGLKPEDRVTSTVSVKSFETGYLVMATARGLAKKTELSAYGNPRAGGIIAINLEDGDSLIEVATTTGRDQIVLGTRDGMSIRFSEEDLRPMGRATYGVVGIRLDPEDRVVDMIIVEPSVTILTACEKGYGKRSAVDAYRLQSRAGKGIINIKATERNGKVVGMKAVRDEDDLIMITSGGQVVRIAVKEVRVMGRNTQGVRLISLDEKDSLVSIARVEKDQDDGGVKRVEVPKDEPTEPETPDEPEPTPSN